MKLDYIENINAYGDNLVRLHDFDMMQASKFAQTLKQTVLLGKKQLELASIDFLECRNCHLTLRISNEDLGISLTEDENLFCDLTIEGYEQMLALLEPFCKKESKGYQMLYEVDSPTDFLFSPTGVW